MNIKLETCLHLATALVIAAAPFFLDPVSTGFTLAAISVAQAVNASAKEHRDSQP